MLASINAGWELMWWVALVTLAGILTLLALCTPLGV